MGLSASDFWFLGAIVVLVMLFMGPGLWSNHNELPVVYFWRFLKRKRKPKDEG